MAKGTPRWIPWMPLLCYAALGYTMGLIWQGHRAFYVYTMLIVFVLLCGLFTMFLLFFRDPERTPGEGIVAPADGKVIKAEESEGPKGHKGKYSLVSVFMNVNNVHVNRAPVEGRVISIRHVPGRFAFAFSKDAETNERAILTLDSGGETFILVLIAGWFARRIQVYVREGEKVNKGQRISIIRFGSRVDLYMPSCYGIEAREGRRTAAGVTTVSSGRKQGRKI